MPITNEPSISDLLNLELVKWFKNQSEDEKAGEQFPGHPNQGYHYNVFRKLLEELINKNVYKNIPKITNLREGRPFTKHGLSHVKDVIVQAQLLIQRKKLEGYEPLLNPYEVFLLLMATLLHDIGMLEGRKDHEVKVSKALNIIESDLADDLGRGEVKKILEIAASHSGPVKKVYDLGHHAIYDNIVERKSLIAMTLRLADELADNRQRVSPEYKDYLEKKGAEAWEIHSDHAYALEIVTIDTAKRDISFTYYIHTDKCKHNYSKDPDKKSYIIDMVREKFLNTFKGIWYFDSLLPDYSLKFGNLNFIIYIYKDPYEERPVKPTYLCARDIPIGVVPECPSLQIGNEEIPDSRTLLETLSPPPVIDNKEIIDSRTLLEPLISEMDKKL